MKQLFAFGLVAIAITGFSACSDGGGKDPPAAADAGDGATGFEPTFTNVFRRVLTGCVQTQCHGSANAGGLRLDGRLIAHQNLVGVLAAGPCVTDAGADAAEAGATEAGGGGGNGGAGSDPGASVPICGCGSSGLTRVIPGNPDESLLIKKLEDAQSCGERMPPTGEPIESDFVDLVRQWIADGATLD